jgi:hypothetical protein
MNAPLPFTAPVYISIHDGWDEACSVVSCGNTDETADRMIAEMNAYAPGRYFKGTVTDDDGYEPDWY